MNIEIRAMKKSDILLAALSAGAREEFSPVQLQKLMFLIDRNVGATLGGPFFKFEPYDYGPFDHGVYREFELLTMSDLAATTGDGPRRQYRLNDAGREEAARVVKAIPQPIAEYIKQLAVWVQSLSFSELVSSVYKAYPDMKVNSVFRG